MKTTIKQLSSYILVAIIAGLLVGCTPEQLNNALTFDSRFYVSAAQDAYVGFGQLPGSERYVIGTADLVAGEWDVQAGLGTADEALDAAKTAYNSGWGSIGFWSLPLTLRAWIVGQLVGEGLSIGSSSFIMAPAALFEKPLFMPSGCTLTDGQYFCNITSY